MKSKDWYWIIFAFLIWRALIFLFSLTSLLLLENQKLFLGGGLENYLQNPLFWGWANFDGEHYLSIAKDGYSHLKYFYFPLYPILVRILAPVNSLFSLNLAALILSHVSFFMSLIGLWKLLSIDYTTKTVKTIILTILFFPTSYYFAANYTESLFLMTVVWSFYFARNGNIARRTVIGILSTATRIIGMALIPAFVIEEYYLKHNKPKRNLVYLFLISIGFLIYVFYLWRTTGNPLEFNAGSEVFGEYRSQSPLLLPQIFYRYIFKIIPNLVWNYFPVVYTTLLEFAIGSLLTLVSLIGFFRMRTSYWSFMVVGFLMPSMYNGFVSLPRYALVLFPFFIILGKYIKNNKLTLLAYFLISIFGLAWGTALFIRGYWVS